MYASKIPIAETLLTGVSIWWAVVLIVQSTVYDSTLPNHIENVSSANEYIWAGAFLTAAAVKVIGLLVMVSWVRKVGLIMSMILYSLICAGYFLAGNYFSTGTGVYFLFTVLAWFGWREVKEYDE